MTSTFLTNFFNVSLLDLILNILLSLALALLISWLYKKTHRGLSYSQSFVFTLVLLTILVTITMMIIGSNLARAFTLLGAFAIIRFRTAVKDTRDTAFIFWALIVGMSVGTANYLIAIVTTVILMIIVWGLTKLNFASARNFDFILNFWLPAGQSAEPLYQPIFEEFLKFENLLNVNSRERGAKLEYTFNVGFIDETKAEVFVQKLNALPGIENVNLLTSRDDIEY